MTAPRWTTALLRQLAAPAEAETLVGDLEEAHRARVARRGVLVATILTAFEAFDVAFLLVRRRVRLPRPSVSWLDVKLGMRMLVRYPVLTIVGGAGLTFAIAIGAAVFAFISLLLWPSLPLPEGDRIVRVLLYDDSTNQYEGRVTADYLRWRGATSTLTDLGAGRGFNHNLTWDDTSIVVNGAEVTASTFDLVRVNPIMGRALTDADALPASPPVIVIGHALWQKFFGGDPAVVGQNVILGETHRTIVGVMPEGFKFPVAHDAWVPLQVDEAAAPRAGASFTVWARLRPGGDLEQATAELAALQARAAADWPATHAHLRPEVKGFAASETDRDPVQRMQIGSVNLGVGLLILLISGNVGLLMFARAATRESEIIVRTALGASRRRLIVQFFSEALLLSGLALVLGLIGAKACLRMGIEYEAADAAAFGRALPFWFYQPLPPLSIAYACGLALCSALVTGVLPAFKVTRGLSSRLRETTAGGGGLKFGGVWTVVIVVQIAVTTTFPMITFFGIAERFTHESIGIGVPPAQVLSARLTRDREIPLERYTAAVSQVRDRLRSVPGVSRVTLADVLPLMSQEHWLIEVDEGGAAPTEPSLDGRYRISSDAVDPEFFAAFETAPLAGRLFTSSDYVDRARTAIANQSFVDLVLGGRNPIGRRVRYWNRTGQPPVAAASPPPWIEIVGLVRDLGMGHAPDPQIAGLYRPLDLSSRSSVLVGVRIAGADNNAAVSAALGQLARQADITLRVTDVQSLDRITANAAREADFWLGLGTAFSVMGLTLSLTGIYAAMSFAVSRRTREIGIRIALGSNGSRVVLAVLRTPLIQVVAGVIAGTLLTFGLSSGFTFVVKPSWAGALGGCAVVMLGVCLLAGLAPVRRALRVDPISALRTE
jgi:predicted permease